MPNGLSQPTSRLDDCTRYPTRESMPVFRVESDVEVEFEVEGLRHRAKVLECDPQRALLESAFRPPVGSVVRIGRMTARVVGHSTSGLAVEFLDVT